MWEAKSGCHSKLSVGVARFFACVALHFPESPLNFPLGTLSPCAGTGARRRRTRPGNNFILQPRQAAVVAVPCSYRLVPFRSISFPYNPLPSLSPPRTAQLMRGLWHTVKTRLIQITTRNIPDLTRLPPAMPPRPHSHSRPEDAKPGGNWKALKKVSERRDFEFERSPLSWPC